MEGMIQEEQVERQYEMEYLKYMEQCVIEGRPSELGTYRILKSKAEWNTHYSSGGYWLCSQCLCDENLIKGLNERPNLRFILD